jgi:hypothetical protein
MNTIFLKFRLVLKLSRVSYFVYKFFVYKISVRNLRKPSLNVCASVFLLTVRVS